MRKPVRPCAAALASTALVLSSVPLAATAQEVTVRELGRPAATYADGLGSLRGVRELPDGRVLIADGLGRALIAWTPGGSADTLANVGEGPEEYRSPDGLFPLPGDRTLLVDLGNARLVEVGPDLSFGDSRPITLGAVGPGMTLLLPVGTDHEGRIYFQQREGGMTERRDSALISRFSPETEEVEALGRVKLQDANRSESGGEGERRVMVRPVPYTLQDDWAVAFDGRVAIARSRPYRLEWLKTDGGVVRGPPIPFDPIPITAADKEEYLASLGAEGLAIAVEASGGGAPRASFSRGGALPGAEAGDPDDYEWPEVKPPFPGRAVWVDDAGRAWVRRHVRAGEPPLFDVFGVNGARIGQVRLPADRRLAGFGDGTVYLVRTDELDFAWLERYAMPSL